MSGRLEHCTACNEELEESQIGLCESCRALDKKWACPKCGSKKLRVVIESWAELFQDGDNGIETSTDDAISHEWDENSAMECSDCGHSDISEEFEVKQ